MATTIEKYYEALSSIIDKKRETEEDIEKAFISGLIQHLEEVTKMKEIGNFVHQYCDVFNGKVSGGTATASKNIGVSSPIYLYADKVPDVNLKYIILSLILSDKLAKIADIDPTRESFGCVKAICGFKTKEEAEKYVLDQNLLDKRCNKNLRIAMNGHFCSLTKSVKADPSGNVRYVTEDKNGRKMIVDTETETIQEETMNKSELEERKHALYEFNKSCEDRTSVAHYIIVKQKYEQLLKSLNDANTFASETKAKVDEVESELKTLDEEFPNFQKVWIAERNKLSKDVLNVDLDKKDTFKKLANDPTDSDISSFEVGPTLFKSS